MHLSSQRSWAAKNPKVTLNANSDLNAVPIFDRDEAPRRLCQHWGGVHPERRGLCDFVVCSRTAS